MSVRRIRFFKSSLSRWDWLDTSVSTLQALQNASGLVPIPYLPEALSIVVRILEGIQETNRNRFEFEELAKDIVGNIVTIRDTILEHPTVHTSHLSRLCQNLVRDMTTAEGELNAIRRECTSSIRRFLYSSRIRREINRQRTLVNRRMRNFQARLLLEIGLSIDERLLRSLALISSVGPGDFKLVDPMNVEYILPLNRYPTYQDFANFLPSLFLNVMGKECIDKGDYEVTRENDHTALVPSTWGTVIGGSTVCISIVLRREDLDSGQCPRCDYICLYAKLGDSVTCSSCQTVFRVSEAFIQDRDASGLPEDNDTPSPSPSTHNHPAVHGPHTATAKTQHHDRNLVLRSFSRFRIFLSNVPVISPAQGVVVNSSHKVGRFDFPRSAGRGLYMGGIGGDGGRATGPTNSNATQGIGGAGGDGYGGTMSVKVALEILRGNDMCLGVGGNGADAPYQGGRGGDGHAATIQESEWDFKEVKGLPHMEIGAFCDEYLVSHKIRNHLKDYGIETVAGAFAITAADLQSLRSAGMLGGHFATLKGALRLYVRHST